MPRYHFNVFDGASYLDPEGTELHDLSAAKAEALRYTCELLEELGDDFWSGEPWTMEVTDDTDVTLLRLTFMAGGAADRRQRRPGVA